MKCSNKNCKQGELKEVDFYKHRNGRRSQCKECMKSKAKDRHRNKKIEKELYAY